MPSYLGNYPNAASNREEKLKRAIDSFLAQKIGELIVIADGCLKTVEIASNYPVVVKLIDKQPHFGGETRNTGIRLALYDYIAYLDNDDVMGENHIKSIIQNLDTDWVYWDDYVAGQPRKVWHENGHIGTSAIAHKKNLDVKWNDGYGHDWDFIQQLSKYQSKRIKANYQVMHIPHIIDK